MKKPDLRIEDEPEIWSHLPRKSDDALDYLYEILIERNEALMTLAEKKRCGPWDEPVRKKVNPAQELFLLFYRMDSQILNGGITQFFWNSPSEVDPIEDAIPKLHQPAFAKLYTKMLDHAEDRFHEWEPLYRKGHENGGEVRRACFSQSYKVLKLSWFDKEYMAKHRKKLVKALIALVLEKKKEFVK